MEALVLCLDHRLAQTCRLLRRQWRQHRSLIGILLQTEDPVLRRKLMVNRHLRDFILDRRFAIARFPTSCRIPINTVGISLALDLPDVSPAVWVHQIEYACLNNYEILYQGEVVDRIYGIWLDLLNQMSAVPYTSTPNLPLRLNIPPRCDLEIRVHLDPMAQLIVGEFDPNLEIKSYLLITTDRLLLENPNSIPAV